MALARPRHLVLAAALALASAAAVAAPPIQQQMTPQEFKAAGLDKLTPDELAALNTWLGRTIESESAKAAATAKKVVVDENRGFLTFGSDEPIVSVLPGRFPGFSKGRVYTLANGQVWRQTDDAELAGVRRDDAEVTIRPGRLGNAWYMSIKGYNTRATVRRVK